MSDDRVGEGMRGLTGKRKEDKGKQEKRGT